MAQLSPLLKQATPVQAARGEGVYLYDTDGRRHLDFTAGIGVTSTGHCHPRVVAAAQEQVATLIHGQYTTVMHQPLLALVERMGEVLPEGIDSVFFTNSGSEAVEASVRLARQATGRQLIVAFDGGFHGRTMGAAALTTSGAKIRAGIGPMMGGVAFAPFPYAYRYGWSEEQAVAFALSELDRQLASTAPASDVAAFIVEPVLGEGGYVPTPPAFLQGLRERADRHGILLIADEVQTGYGRTGKFWGTSTPRTRPGHHRHRQGARVRLPALGHRRAPGPHGEGLARFAGRHLRRERRRLRRRARDPRVVQGEDWSRTPGCRARSSSPGSGTPRRGSPPSATSAAGDS